MSRTGKCLCGQVKATVDPIPSMQACHCDMCRRWGGGPFMSVPCKSATYDGPVQRYASSEHADRGFCGNCGTHLFFFVRQANIYAVPVGLLDDQSGLPFRAEIYVDERPDFYCFANEAKQMTGAEFEAKFRG